MEAAGIAHDVGVFVEYRAHHRHSMAMILNAEWSGWNEEDKRLVALIARYHRKAEPAKRHAEYSALSKEERSLVRRMAAVLRVADGLDRSHTQAVRGVGVKVARGRCVVEVDALGDVAVDLADSWPAGSSTTKALPRRRWFSHRATVPGSTGVRTARMEVTRA